MASFKRLEGSGVASWERWEDSELESLERLNGSGVAR